MALHVNGKTPRETTIKADNCDTRVPLSHLITITLKYIGECALKEVNQSVSVPLTASHVHWVITVPAIWDNAAKQIMLDAAEAAGLTSDESPQNLTLALEPGNKIL